MGGKEIQKILGIEHEKERSISDKAPLKMMDIVLKVWGQDSNEDSYEHEPEDDEDEYGKQ